MQVTEKFKTALKAFMEAYKNADMKFKDVKLQDGTIARYDGEMPTVGMPMIVVESNLPLPDGEYPFEDGTVVTIANGVIAEVKPGTPAENPDAGATPPETDMNEKPVTGAQAKAIVESVIKETRFAEQLEEVKKEIAENKTVKENFAAQKESTEKELKELKAVVEKQSTTIDAMFKLMEELGKEASETPAEPTQKFSVSEARKTFKANLEDLQYATKK